MYFKTPVGPTPWLCEIKGQWHDVSAPSLLTTNNGNWLLKKAILGQCILMMPRWVLSTYLQSKQLVELDIKPSLTVTQNPSIGIFLLYQKQRYQVPKLKAAIDFLVARIKVIKF